jgi:hypothetical protein
MCEMRRSILSVLITAIVVSGCGYTMPVVLNTKETTPGDAMTIARLNDRLAGRHVVLHTFAAGDIEGQYISCVRDSCWYLDASTTSSESLPTSSIRSIEYRNHATGIVCGFLVGAGACAGTGALLKSVADGATGGDVSEMGLSYVAVLGVLAGGATGAFFYGMEGARNEYEFVQDTLSVNSVDKK